MRLTGFLAACGIALLILAGCGDSGSGTGSATSSSTGPERNPSAGRTQIAIISSGMSDYWQAVHAGAVKAQLETAKPPANKPTIDIVWRDTRNQDTSQAQIRTVEDIIGMKVAAIVLAPGDAEALRDVVERAAGKRIPVIIMDSALSSEKVRAFVGTDEKHGGDLAGQYLSKLMGAKGKVIVLHAQAGRTLGADREAGFAEALKDDAGVALVSTDREGGASSDTAYSAAKSLLEPFVKPDGSCTVDGIFTPSESTTLGMLRAVRERKLGGKVKFVGYGNSAELVKGLENGEIQGLVLARPMNMGYLAVKTAIDAIKEKKLEKSIDSGILIATKENLKSAETQEILHPDLDKWLK